MQQNIISHAVHLFTNAKDGIHIYFINIAKTRTVFIGNPNIHTDAFQDTTDWY